MSFRRLIIFFVLTSSVSCAQFHQGKSILAGSGFDHRRFFRPHHDFPVIEGDVDENWSTPFSQTGREIASDQNPLGRSERFLKSELQQLEARQDLEDLQFYNRHKHQFKTSSEKIYFLKLPHYERKDYLVGRGFMNPSKPAPESYSDKVFSLNKNDVNLGMKKEDVLSSCGKPLKVEIAGNPRHQNERWLYRFDGAPKYIYFESGEVQGWE
jgi:hypothetical protein